MQIRFIGDIKRTNSFGTFESGKLYDVSDKVGEQLLTVPGLFVPKDAPLPDKSKDRIIEVDESGEGGSDYDNLNIEDLRSLCRKRGIILKRAVRRAELVKLLRESNDAITDVTNTAEVNEG